MKRVAKASLFLLLGILAFSFGVPLFQVHGQDHWVTFPGGNQIHVNKNAPRFYSYTTEHGKLKILQKEDPQEVVKVIVTLKDKPLALLKKKNTLQKTSFAAVLSSLQSVHSSVKSKISTIAQQLSARTNFQYQYTLRREYYTAINGMALECNRGMIKYIRNMPEVKSVQPDGQVKADLTQSVHQIRADVVQDSLGYKGDSVLVGEVDTGIDYDNPALGGGFGLEYRVIGGYDFANNDNDPMDDHGHGTHVAGIIGANGGNGLRGVAPHVNFLAVKVLSADGSGYFSDVIAGIEYCMDPDGNPATDDGVDVINMSLGGASMTDSPVDIAVDNATQAGILSVIAAGNEGQSNNSTNPFLGYTTISTPGTAMSALTVGACDSMFTVADFSSKGPDRIHYAIKPEVVAPGVHILSTLPNNATASWSGTSMATPHATGVAALLKQQHRDWSPEQLKAAIVNSARPTKGSLYMQGNGCVDALHAATLGISVDPGVISFGIVDLTVDVWKDTVEFKVKNLKATLQNINLEIQASLPAGVELNLSQTSFTLDPMQESTVTATITVPSSVSILSNPPYAYTGTIICRSDSDRVQIPFAVNKINTLVIDCDRIAWELMLYDHYTIFSIPELYGMDYKYIVPMQSGTFNLFALLQASDDIRSRDTFYCITRKDINTKGYNYISLNHSEAAFSAFNDLDQVRDINSNPVGGLDSSLVVFEILVNPAPSYSFGCSFLGYTPRLGQWYLGPMDSSLSITILQEIISLQVDEVSILSLSKTTSSGIKSQSDMPVLLLKTMSSSIKSKSDLALLSGPDNLGDLHLKFKYNSSPTTGPFVQTNDVQYFAGAYNVDVFNGVHRLPNLQEIHFMSNRNTMGFNPMKYCSMSAGICTFGNNGPTWQLSTSDFIIDEKGDLVFFERKPFRPDLSEYAHLQTLPSGDTVSIEVAPTTVVQVPKFQFSYPNDRTELGLIEYTPDFFDDGGVIHSDGIHARIFKDYPTSTQQFTAQMFTKNGLLQGANALGGNASLYYKYSNVNRYTDRYRLLAITDRYNLLGQYGQATIDFEFNVRPVPHQDCILPTLDFFQILGNDRPVQWLHPAQDGKVHLVISDPKQNVDSVGIFLLENDGTEIGLETIHPSAKEYFASIPKTVADGFHDVIARVHNTESNNFELITSPAFYYGSTSDSIHGDARLFLSTYTLDNIKSVHFNAGDTLKYTLTYKNYGNRTIKNVAVRLSQTDYFVPVGNSTITIDSIVPGPFRGQKPCTIPITLVFRGKKQPGDLQDHYTPTITWNSGGKMFSRKHSILVDFSGTLTTVSEFGDEAPKEFSLAQNYPNPFNPNTTISFSLPSRSFATLKVFDLLGRVVATIVSEDLNAGTYSRQWIAGSMASGVYFYRLQAGTYSTTKKLLLLK